MVVTGYVALKIHKYILQYADWTNTRRKYRLHNLTSNNVKDLKRVFNGKTIVLIVDLEQSLQVIHKVLGPVDTSKCLEVADAGLASQILNFYLERNQKKKSYYNYQREHWLTLLSVINIHLMLHGGSLPKNKVLKIIQRELIKYKRDITANVILDKFVSMNLYIYQKIDIGDVVVVVEPYKDSMVSLPDSKID